MLKIGLFIPTLNPGINFKKTISMVNQQAGNFELRKLIIDSESTDNTIQLAQQAGFEYKTIPRITFTHGKVRRIAVNLLSDCDYIVFLSQDVYLQENALKNILEFICSNRNMALAYGKQRSDPQVVGWLNALDRQFNYSDTSLIKNWQNRKLYGLKTVFSSDAFAIYDKNILLKLGNFPEKVNFSEDMLMASLAIKAQYSIGYCAQATCIHNQGLNYYQLYKRYRKISNFNKQYPWIRKQFGGATSEGIKLVKYELDFLISQKLFYLIPSLIIRSAIKYVAFRI